VADLGVSYAATGAMLTPVSGTPTAAGQYQVTKATNNGITTGTYMFNANDANAAVLITYSYATTTGTSLSLSNQLMGSGPTFSLVLNEQYQGKLLNLQLNSVIAPKLALAFKHEDFMIPEFDFQAAADAAGNIGNIWLSE